VSVAFTKEDSAETASEAVLPDRPVSSALNLVTEEGLAALRSHLSNSRRAYEAAQSLEDVNERRRQSAVPLRDLRYYAERVRTAQLVANPPRTGVVAFGSTVTFQRSNRPSQTFRIVGEDEADPKAGSISYVSPVAAELMGKEVGEIVSIAGGDLEVLSIQ
jgi:transcription elongation GreA/GreB family factor